MLEPARATWPWASLVFLAIFLPPFLSCCEKWFNHGGDGERMGPAVNLFAELQNRFTGVRERFAGNEELLQRLIVTETGFRFKGTLLQSREGPLPREELMVISL